MSIYEQIESMEKLLKEVREILDEQKKDLEEIRLMKEKIFGKK